VFVSDLALPRTLTLRTIPGFEGVATATAEDRCAAHDRLTVVLCRLGLAARDAVVREVLDWSGAGARDPLAPRPMTAAEVARLAAMPGMTIGAHSENHLWLPEQDHAARRREIAAGKARLERLLGRTVASFAYPYGACDPATAVLVGEAGFSVAVTTEETPLGSGRDPLRLPRVDMRRLGDADVASILAGGESADRSAAVTAPAVRSTDRPGV
jgi:peptidoglycan/xylan/chitin deacetylase (PgdA/CDA1 family)